MPQNRLSVVEHVQLDLCPGVVVVNPDMTLTVMGFEKQGLKVHLTPDMALATAISLGTVAMASGASEARAMLLFHAAQLIRKCEPQEPETTEAVQ